MPEARFQVVLLNLAASRCLVPLCDGMDSATLGIIVCRQEGLQVLLQLIVAVVVIPFNRCVLQRPVHPFDLPVGPRMIDLGEAVLNAVFPANAVEYMLEA